MKDLSELRAKFISSYANVPQTLKKEIIAIFEGEPYSWQTAYYEIKEKTELGENILKELNQLGLL